MWLVLSITFHRHCNIWGCMCSTGPFQLLFHVIIIIKLEVSTLPIVIIFCHGWVPEMFVTSYSVTYWICIPGKPGFCFHYYFAVYEFKYNRIYFGFQIVFSCLYITPSHYYHCANLSEDIKFIKCLSDIFLRVCEQDWAYSLSYTIYGTVCFQFTHLPCDDGENISFVLLSSANQKYELIPIV